jgi:hypothetical protein
MYVGMENFDVIFDPLVFFEANGFISWQLLIFAIFSQFWYFVSLKIWQTMVSAGTEFSHSQERSFFVYSQ